MYIFCVYLFRPKPEWDTFYGQYKETKIYGGGCASSKKVREYFSRAQQLQVVHLDNPMQCERRGETNATESDSREREK